MFPILDVRGRPVAFGGRVLGEGEPKYLNSPETPLFHKGHIVYGFSQARPSASDKAEIIIAEGYMDVIALAQAGITNAVAPLGTALTENQIALLSARDGRLVTVLSKGAATPVRAESVTWDMRTGRIQITGAVGSGGR